MKTETSRPKKLHIKKNDIVIVRSGNDRGKSGKVLFVDPHKGRAIVEGINIVHKHTRPNARYPNGSIEKKEAPVHISKLMLRDPKTGEGTRVGRQLVDGKLKRYAKKSGQIIDK
jgi:large subunit ribosomal protein L24